MKRKVLRKISSFYGTPPPPLLTFEGLPISSQSSSQSSSSTTGPLSDAKTNPLRMAHLSLHVSIILIKQNTTISASAIPMM